MKLNVYMKKAVNLSMAMLGVFALGVTFAPSALAGCGDSALNPAGLNAQLASYMMEARYRPIPWLLPATRH
jgi:hypothetical protein